MVDAINAALLPLLDSCCVELLTALSPPANSDKAKIITFTFTQLRRIQSLRPRSLPVAFEYLLRPSRYSTTVAIHFSDQSHRLALILLGSDFFYIFPLSPPSTAFLSAFALHCFSCSSPQPQISFTSSQYSRIHHTPSSQSTPDSPVERLLQLA